MNKKGGGTILVSALLILAAFTIAVTDVSAATSPSLGVADSFGVLGHTTVTNTGPTTITGNLGDEDAGVIPGLASITLLGGGTVQQANALAGQAQVANTAAFLALSALPNVACTVDYGAVTKDLVGLKLEPGVYCADVFQLSGTLTLDDTGNAAGVWIFRTTAAAAALTTSPGVGARVQFLTGIGSPCNVWWKVASSATIGSGTTFIGNILALTSISLGTGASLNGRALAQTGAVTLDSNTIGAICSVATTTTAGTTSSSSDVSTSSSSDVTTSSSSDVTTSSSSDVTTSSTTVSGSTSLSTVDDQVIVRTTVIDTVQSTTYLGTSPYLTLVSTVGTSTSTSYSTSRTTVGGTVSEHVTEFDTVYAYVLVILEQLQNAVGGFVEPVNKLAVFAPYLALFGVIAAVAVFVVAPWKKHED